jgi:hypothetical protein
MNCLGFILLAVLFQSCFFSYAFKGIDDVSSYFKLNSALRINRPLMQKWPGLQADRGVYQQELTKFQNHQKDRLQKMNLAYSFHCKCVLNELLEQAIASNKLCCCESLSCIYEDMLTSSDFSSPYFKNILKENLLTLHSAIYCLPDEEFSQTVLGCAIDRVKKSRQVLSQEEFLSLTSEAGTMVNLVKRSTPEIESLDDIIKHATESCIFIARKKDCPKVCHHLIRAYQKGGAVFQEYRNLLETTVREIEIKQDLQEIAFQFLEGRKELFAQRPISSFYPSPLLERPFLNEFLLEDLLSLEKITKQE